MMSCILRLPPDWMRLDQSDEWIPLNQAVAVENSAHLKILLLSSATLSFLHEAWQRTCQKRARSPTGILQRRVAISLCISSTGGSEKISAVTEAVPGTPSEAADC